MAAPIIVQRLPRPRILFIRNASKGKRHSSRLLNALQTSIQHVKHSSSCSDRLVGVIGLEVHAQINSKSKLFSGASTSYGASPNSQVSYFDAALPGTLPVLNKYCVVAAVKTALCFGCHVNNVSYFDRKHYFYADMPAGYQITQQKQPIATGGEVEYVVYVRGKHKTASRHRARLHQIQLEQDSGKSIHDGLNSRSLVDLNRAGVGLMEIVTKPDFTNGEEASAFVREVQAALIRLNCCDGKMEEGSLRVDANVSVHVPGEPFGVRTEVKNLNSLKSVQQAIDYELVRQKELVSRGFTVVNKTQSFNTANRQTQPMRDKEVLQDYRFMAEPNLPPIVLNDGPSNSPHILSISEMKKSLPELRSEARNRLLSAGLSLEHTATLMELDLVACFDQLAAMSGLPATDVSRSLFSFLYKVVMMFCGERKITAQMLFEQVSYQELSSLWCAMKDGVVNPDTCRMVLHARLDDSSSDILTLVASGAYDRITDPEQIRTVCSDIIQHHPSTLKKYLKKKQPVHFSHLLKAVIRAGQTRIDSQSATRSLRQCLDELEQRQQ